MTNEEKAVELAKEYGIDFPDNISVDGILMNNGIIMPNQPWAYWG